MFDWYPYVTPELTATSESGNAYYITPVVQDEPNGPWTCAAIMVNGNDHRPRVFETRQRAEFYAEELEVEYHSE